MNFKVSEDPLDTGPAFSGTLPAAVGSPHPDRKGYVWCLGRTRVISEVSQGSPRRTGTGPQEGPRSPPGTALLFTDGVS